MYIVYCIREPKIFKIIETFYNKTIIKYHMASTKMGNGTY